ncbi:outer membrane beta-barrel protein [Changchengzhania lutea]|uniref:outer membrane beta-barrel protein n=1 Tax=Changchengzhania lutea TaxID=2049305 RepID=UPI00115C85AC|nr:outer membrane beta-barrel family protein [Changchengzhania lutea]
MNSKLLFFFLLSFSFLGLSQNIELTGLVKDTNNQPIAYANVTLHDAEDAGFISGTITNVSGEFKLENINTGNYNLKISFLTFEAYQISIFLNKNKSIDAIVLKDKIQTLDGVTIIATRPTVKRFVDRLVFNVENSTLSDNNVLDVLKHTPGVLVNQDAITVRNSTPTIYINDRKVHLSADEIQQLLEGASASNVKSIEVITNPPAKYEAEGGAVLNIITSKNIAAGYNGRVFGNYKQGFEYPKYAVGTSHFFKTKKLNTYFNYSLSPRKDYRHNDEFVNFIENDQVVSSWETDFKRTRESSNHNINTNLDYQINANNSIGISANALIAPRANTGTKVNAFTEVYGADTALDSIFNTKNNIDEERTNLAFTVDYIHKFKRAGEKLSISAHHTNYDFKNDQIVNTDYFLANNNFIRNNTFQTLSSQDIQLFTAQMDYELPINDSEHFESGLKITEIESKSILTQNNLENGAFVLDDLNSDIFLYKELNYAAYSSYTKDWESWSLKAGLRAEYTDIQSNSLSTTQVNDNDYLKFFPSMYVLHNLNDKNVLYLSYNKRIQRPRYSQLNPFKYFINDNAYSTGDPNLKPQIDDIVTLGYTLNDTYTFELYYRYENDPAMEISFQDNDSRILKNIDTNIDRNISYGLDFITYTKIIPRWNLYALSSVFYYENRFFALESNNELYTTDEWSVYLQLINYFTLLKDKSLNIDVSFNYISPIVDGPRIISDRSGLNINLRKTFWNNRASLSLGVNDMFNSQNFTQITKYLNQDSFLKSRMENRLVTFGFNYKFGNFRLQNNSKAIDNDERDRLGSN